MLIPSEFTFNYKKPYFNNKHGNSNPELSARVRRVLTFLISIRTPCDRLKYAFMANGLTDFQTNYLTQVAARMIRVGKLKPLPRTYLGEHIRQLLKLNATTREIALYAFKYDNPTKYQLEITRYHIRKYKTLVKTYKINLQSE